MHKLYFINNYLSFSPKVLLGKNAVNFFVIKIPKWYSLKYDGGFVNPISLIMKEHDEISIYCNGYLHSIFFYFLEVLGPEWGQSHMILLLRLAVGLWLPVTVGSQSVYSRIFDLLCNSKNIFLNIYCLVFSSVHLTYVNR